jgi:DNA-binding MarR family transcriptional regulator
MSRSPGTTAADLMAAIDRIRRLTNRLSRQLQLQLGISVYQLGILAAVDDGARHLHEVADATGHHVSGASRLVDRLVRDGLLERHPDPDDRRAVVLALTATGRERLADAWLLVGNTIRRALEDMAPADARQLAPALGAFLDAADRVLDPPAADRPAAP